MSRFEVEPAQLGAGSSRAAVLASALADVRGRLATAAAAASAAGQPAAEAAIGEACGGLDGAVEGLRQRAAGLGANLDGAATAYTTTDRAAMPGRRG
jgi:hypothetical protein